MVSQSCVYTIKLFSKTGGVPAGTTVRIPTSGKAEHDTTWVKAALRKAGYTDDQFVSDLGNPAYWNWCDCKESNDAYHSLRNELQNYQRPTYAAKPSPSSESAGSSKSSKSGSGDSKKKESKSNKSDGGKSRWSKFNEWLDEEEPSSIINYEEDLPDILPNQFYYKNGKESPRGPLSRKEFVTSPDVMILKTEFAGSPDENFVPIENSAELYAEVMAHNHKLGENCNPSGVNKTKMWLMAMVCPPVFYINGSEKNTIKGYVMLLLGGSIIMCLIVCGLGFLLFPMIIGQIIFGNKIRKMHPRKFDQKYIYHEIKTS